MKFFEESKLWDEVPAWVSQAIMIGYKLRKTTTKTRTLFLLSIPCNTQTASLIALGALRCDLEDPAANTSENHFDVMVEQCKKATSVKNKKRTSSQWELRHISEKSTWFFDYYEPKSDVIYLQRSNYREYIKQNGKYVKNQNGPCLRQIFRNNSLQWQLRDQPIPELQNHNNSYVEKSIYEKIGSFHSPIFNKNLARSYDGLLLISKGSSLKSKYMHKLSHMGYEENGTKYSLADLLTLHNNEKEKVKRLRQLNENSLENESSNTHGFIIADGINSLIKSDQVFSSSNIIAVCNRSGSVESIEQLRLWLTEKERYYSTKDPEEFFIPSLPQGIILRILERKGQ